MQDARVPEKPTPLSRVPEQNHQHNTRSQLALPPPRGATCLAKPTSPPPPELRHAMGDSTSEAAAVEDMFVALLASNFQDHLFIHPDAAMRCRKSKMHVAVSSDLSHLSAKKARSRVGGCFYLSKPASPNMNDPPPPTNGTIHVNASIIRPAMASVAEAEMGATLVNDQAGCATITALEETGWPQGTVQITTDDECAVGFAMKQ